MDKIVILGAGLTGLSAAYHLEQKGFYNYEIFEKENEIGGLCRSVYQDGFTFDFTGHLLHVSDDYFANLIQNIIGLENMNSINRRSFVYSNNTYTHYPFQINLHGLPQEVVIECIEGFLTRYKSKKNPRTFYEWVMKNFGSGFAKYFFVPFQTKIFDYNIKKVTSSWTGRFVPQTSLKQIIAGALQEPSPSNVGYNSQFYYPKEGGIFFWIKKLANQIRKPINTNHCVESIDLTNKIIIFKNGHEQRFEKIINTIPLDYMLNSLKEKSSTNLKKASKKLICNSVINFNLGISRPDLSNKHWIYVPEAKFPFYRLGFPHNFSEKLVPNGCSSLYGEFSYINKSEEQINEILKNSINKTKELLQIKNDEIITQKVIQIPRAYVIYDFWREKNLPILLNELEQNSIYSAGRYGQWKYSSMQEAVLDGKKVADELTMQQTRIIPAKKVEEFEKQNKNIKQKEL
jgi:protoporphyrinogen oxidase